MKKIKKKIIAQHFLRMQGNRGDHVSLDLPQVLVRAIYDFWKVISNYYIKLHVKSCHYLLIMYMKRVWEMIGHSTISHKCKKQFVCCIYKPQSWSITWRILLLKYQRAEILLYWGILTSIYKAQQTRIAECYCSLQIPIHCINSFRKIRELPSIHHQ